MDYVTDLIKAERMPDGMRTFTNHQRGRPYIVSGTRPKAEKIIENRGDYKRGTVPDGVLYLTIGGDVQRGSANDPENPPRIELEVLGIGALYQTWSIEYKRFEGDVTDPYSGAWEKLNEWMLETELSFVRGIDGFVFPVCMIFLDSGDGELTDVVYEFCKRWINTYPIKGQRVIARKKGEKPDELTDASIRRYKYSKLSEDTGIYIISTVWYKNQLYNNLKVQRQESGPQKPGFCNFPYDYPEKYFDMLTAEEKVSEGGVTYYESHGRRNEALDARVYALCAADVFLDAELTSYRLWAKAKRWKNHRIQQISHRTIIENMIASTARVGPGQ
jgi:phage terminase large subunit GpA-like protein